MWMNDVCIGLSRLAGVHRCGSIVPHMRSLANSTSAMGFWKDLSVTKACFHNSSIGSIIIRNTAGDTTTMTQGFHRVRQAVGYSSTAGDSPTHPRPPKSTKERFLDRVRITAIGGRGGSGAASYTRVSKGRYIAASGGDGAPGGNVVLVASAHLNELRGVPRHAKAGRGGPGGKNGRTGAVGKDVVVRVPLGTQVYLLRYPQQELPLAGVDENEPETISNSQSNDNGTDETGRPDDLEGFKGFHATTSTSDAAQHIMPVAVDAVHINAEVQKASGPDSHDGTDDSDDNSHDRTAVLQQPVERELICELLAEGQEIIVAHGGAGGLGNASLSKPTGRSKLHAHAARHQQLHGAHHQEDGNVPVPDHQQPGPTDSTTVGEEGTRAEIQLELKLLADVGFVGMPNAGKSSLLSVLTAARAKVGNYAFTTLHPQLGTVMFDDHGGPDTNSAATNRTTPSLPRHLTLADIPGLIEGAHEDRGRGNAFLRHVERVRCLVYVLDLSGGQPGALLHVPPLKQLEILQAELTAYRQHLAGVPSIIAANKVDAVSDPGDALQALMAGTMHPIVPVSATHQAGLDQLKHVMRLVVARPTRPGCGPGLCDQSGAVQDDPG